MKDDQDHFNVLRKIKSNPEATQRKLASELDFSLGKLNYCLKALKAKGLIKIQNFKKNPKNNTSEEFSSSVQLQLPLGGFPV